MINMLTVVGARPQFIKASAIHRVIKGKFSNSINETIIHTGQHYDERLSDLFFNEMELPKADINLKVGSDTHARQTSYMMEGIERVLKTLSPDTILVYGDTNSTLAGAITANKMHIPVVHVEAGVRSRSKTTPEEINRIMTDHLSSVLCAPTINGFNNLIKEGFNAYSTAPFSVNNPIIANTGDLMLDNVNYYTEQSQSKLELLDKVGVKPEEYCFMTLHRSFNTDSATRLNALIEGVVEFSSSFNMPVVFAVHPRTTKAMDELLNEEMKKVINNGKQIITVPPASYLETLMFLKNSAIVFTDSGGLQKEAYFFKKPIAILRERTEWYELVKQGNAVLTGIDKNKLLETAEIYLKQSPRIIYPPVYGDGNAAEKICIEILRYFNEIEE